MLAKPAGHARIEAHDSHRPGIGFQQPGNRDTGPVDIMTALRFDLDQQGHAARYDCEKRRQPHGMLIGAE